MADIDTNDADTQADCDEMNEEATELDGGEVVEAWLEQNNATRMEGETGVGNLEKLVEALGYRNTGFRFGTPIEAFLVDNPGAVEALVEFIKEWTDSSDEWRSNLEEDLKEE